MAYRNIFFNEESFARGRGAETAEYYGSMYSHSAGLPNFFALYDKDLDLVVPCTSCAKRKYAAFVKVPAPGGAAAQQTPAKPAEGRKKAPAQPSGAAHPKPKRMPMKADGDGCKQCKKNKRK